MTRRLAITADLKLGSQSDEVLELKGFLTHFGYLPPTGAAPSNVLDAATRRAVHAFQELQGLERTGEIDAPTRDALEEPRCGAIDIIPVDGGWAHKLTLSAAVQPQLTPLSYRLEGDWQRGTLTASIAAQEARAAFGTWESVCGVRFTQAADGASVDILVRMIGDAHEHGDGRPFDGQKGEVAHAFYPWPELGGLERDIHLDGAETWAPGGAASGLSVRKVLLHEIGHVLGLVHVYGRPSVMIESFDRVEETLTNEDIAEAVRLYGPPTL